MTTLSRRKALGTVAAAAAALPAIGLPVTSLARASDEDADVIAMLSGLVVSSWRRRRGRRERSLRGRW